ncbi:DUF4227 family protein [Gracilibacillus oryzae]|uniref:DUF4227 family protein n=1 Tax=Gracilibacillus oryzae TaxID=1672701 RepID=A0A7C8GVY1_9BACI|nr:DUF4227 family protein [Gracilibacillus oryzae]KAB8138391.1 DUF4227 family protein [Gracilibacillus oryzae]
MQTIVRAFYEMIKVLVIFVLCTFLFYYVIKALHQEYEKLDRYDAPQGTAVKVFHQEDDSDLWDRLNIFFRLGE